MDRKNIHNSGQARIFQNRYLEILTKAHPALIWAMYIPILIFMLYSAHEVFKLGMQVIVLLVVLGMIFWTFFEYTAHRYLFHYISESPKTQRITYIFHGNHHEYPRDRQRLVMPVVPSLILATLIFGFQYLFIGDYTLAFFPGFIFGYLLYVSLHYAIHAFEPPFEFMKPLWRNHQMHHYRNEHLGFGVSNTFWDKVFGTTFDLRKYKEDPEKAKELMIEAKDKK